LRLRPDVIAAIEVGKAEVTVELLVAELAKIGISDERRMFTTGGNLLAAAELHDNTTVAGRLNRRGDEASAVAQGRPSSRTM
jgi:hypothetical protein